MCGVCMRACMGASMHGCMRACVYIDVFLLWIVYPSNAKLAILLQMFLRF